MMGRKLSKNNRGEISWFTPPGIGVGNGYGYAAIETIKALQRLDVNIPFQSDDMMHSKKTTAKCHVSFVQPVFYQGTPDQFRVGYTPWESSKIPDEWIPRMQRMDEIWTPATWVADIYKSYNVNSTIRYVPHGFDPEVWKIFQRYEKDTFTFLHVGGPAERKGAQRVVDAFVDLFGNDKSVSLILKSNGPSEARVKFGGVFGNAGHHPQISVIEHSMEVEDLAALYSTADCLVYPTNGEGFGLIPFQGIATGIPTIVTDATACSDFAQYAIPLKATPTPGEGVHLGDWYEPDPEHLRHLMLEVRENFDAAKEHAMHGAIILRNKFTWDHIAKMIVDILGDQIYERI
jgi:glycosyltransferase involved in cell wall biosynthesis